MASAPRPGVTRRAEEAAAHVTFTIDGESFTLWPGEVTAKLASEFRAETGRSFRKTIELMSADPDLDLIRELMWLVRRQRGEVLSIDDIDIRYDTAIEFETDPVEDVDSPEL